MPDIFLSYAREDEPAARLLATALEARGWSVWWDRRIPHGQDFNAYIQQQLDAARCIVVLWSKASLASQFVRDEATEGLNGRLVPAFVEAVKPPLGFRQLHAADLSDWHGRPRHDEFDRLVGSIGAIVPPSLAAAPLVSPGPLSPATEPEPAGPLPSTHAYSGVAAHDSPLSLTDDTGSRLPSVQPVEGPSSETRTEHPLATERSRKETNGATVGRETDTKRPAWFTTYSGWTLLGAAFVASGLILRSVWRLGEKFEIHDDVTIFINEPWYRVDGWGYIQRTKDGIDVRFERLEIRPRTWARRPGELDVILGEVDPNGEVNAPLLVKHAEDVVPMKDFSYQGSVWLFKGGVGDAFVDAAGAANALPVVVRSPGRIPQGRRVVVAVCWDGRVTPDPRDCADTQIQLEN